MGRKVTQEEFAEKLKKKNPNLIVIGQYINMKNSIRVKCLNVLMKWILMLAIY